jgi:hypothetical protein
MNDTLAIFFMGVGAGALAIYVPWIHHSFQKFVNFAKCPSPAHCPHHKDVWARRVHIDNDRTRNGPTRPPMK